MRTNTWKEGRGDTQWRLEKFSNICLEREFDLNEKVDDIALLSDKASAVGLESWPREFDSRYHRLRYGKHVDSGPVKNRRLLL